MEPTGKRRRLSSPVRQRLSARSKLLQHIIGSSQHPYGSSSSTGAAFSNNGLVAYRVFNDAQTSESSAALSHPVTIAIRPLLAAWKVRPLLLQPPLSVHPDISYDIELLQFSPSSSTLIPSLRHALRCQYVGPLRFWLMIAGMMTSSDSTISRIE